MTSPTLEIEQPMAKTIQFKVVGKAAEYVYKAVMLLKQTRSYLEGKLLDEALPFYCLSHLDPKRLTLHIELIPTEEFYDVLEKEMKRIEGVDEETRKALFKEAEIIVRKEDYERERKKRTQNTTHESNHSPHQ